MLKLIELRNAAIAARKTDPTVGVAVKAGRLQVQSITYGNSGVSTIRPLSEWVSYADCIKQLEGMASGRAVSE